MKTHRLLVLLTILGVLFSSMVGTVAAAKGGLGTQKVQKVTKIGTTRISGSASRFVRDYDLFGEERPEAEQAVASRDAQIRNPIGSSRVSSSFVPRPATQPVVDGTGTTHFNGLNHFQQRFAGTGAYTNTQFSLEPPDQGLCVGNGYVLEVVNTVIRVRDTAGASLTSPEPLNQFFGLAPEIIRSVPLVFGPFSTDPKCYYDPATSRWFVTLLEIDVDSATGDFTERSNMLLAVSVTNNPTGTWNLYTWDVTNDGNNGTPDHSALDCPCFGDQPLVGADANGFYVSTNEFPTFVPGFNGAMVYALDKAALAAGAGSPNMVSIFEPTLAEGQAYSLQPATTPPGAAYASGNGGTEYLLSALEFTGGLDNRIALWALTNTSSLSGSPSLTVQQVIVGSEVYGLPPKSQQRAGSTPLLNLIKAGGFGTIPSQEHLNLINSNDDRMNQAIYQGGHVWGALNTVVKGPVGETRTGIAWFSVSPTWSGATLTGGSIYAQGYVSARDNNVMFPAVAVNSSGKALVGFSLVGAGYFPSAAYASIGTSGTGSINVVRWGSGPADGFTGYLALDAGDGGVERWGDYSAAVADASGNLWFATESINQTCSTATFFADSTCGGTRSLFANWGTTIAKVVPTW